MQFERKIAIANLAVMVPVAIAWIAGARDAAFIAVGTATYGFAVLWPQYRYERGLWMVGPILILFTVFALFSGFLDLFAGDIPGAGPSSAIAAFTLTIAIGILSLFLAFSIYATIVNYRLSRSLRKSMQDCPDALQTDGEP